MNRETTCARKPGTFAPSLLAPQQRQGHICRKGGNPEIGPDPNQKREPENLAHLLLPSFDYDYDDDDDDYY